MGVNACSVERWAAGRQALTRMRQTHRDPKRWLRLLRSLRVCRAVWVRRFCISGRLVGRGRVGCWTDLEGHIAIQSLHPTQSGIPIGQIGCRVAGVQSFSFICDQNDLNAAIADHHERPATGGSVQWLANLYVYFTLIFE